MTPPRASGCSSTRADLTALVFVKLQFRRGCLLVSQHQPIDPAPALPTAQPTSDVLEQHVPAELSGQRLMVERDAPPAGGTERPEGERSVISERAEDDGARLGQGSRPRLSDSDPAER